MMRNLFCDFDDLGNESDVEQSFARRLLEALGYPDRAIRTKATLESLSVGRTAGDFHRPDFALKVAGHIRWILEAKHPDERIEDHVEQARDYCNTINRAYSQASPVKYFVVTNAKNTHLYRVTDYEPIISLDFTDFADRNPSYETFMSMLSANVFAAGNQISTSAETLNFTKPSIAEVNSVFAQCHQLIYRSDRISQAVGFSEFVKLITLKLLSDKQIKDNCPGLVAERRFECPADEIEFSVRWIESQSTPNPVNSILFRDFMNEVEKEIAMKIRKRFFDQGEEIILKPETIKGVIARLESLYLFGIDADLNGRLFENFLSATMRGKDLGQYFTPRTLVKLGVGLGDLRPSYYVLDGCCGTGGFLIDALADMWGKINRNESLSDEMKAIERQTIANERIYGIDFAKDPNLAKIARLNMYLHGDGGSRIFNLDSLDKGINNEISDTPAESVEKDEIRQLELANSFDVVLTNPPFSKTYDRAQAGDERILNQYDIAAGRQRVLAKILFFEMYHHYLKPGGYLVSVIDDGFLNGSDYKWFRDKLREFYTVKAVISLPGDAFQRSEARVKTSFIVLQKRHESDPYSSERHPQVFMYACRYVGIDDPKRARWMPGDDEQRDNAMKEVAEVVREYRAFISGQGTPDHIALGKNVRDRLDVKHCLTEHSRIALTSPLTLADIAEPRKFDGTDIINCKHHDRHERLLTVRYDGTAAQGNVILPKIGTQYSQLFKVKTGDIVISNIAVNYGSTAVVPADLSGSLVSKEYTVLQAKPGYDARIIWAVMRSPGVRAELLLRTTGANRTRVRWPDMKDMAFPYPDAQTAQTFIQRMEAAEQSRAAAISGQQTALSDLNAALSLDEEQSHQILDAFKPPS